MNFLANENFPLASIRFLRNAVYKVISVIEETPWAKDIEVLKRANQEKLIILTFDRDYGELIYKYKLPVPYGLCYNYDRIYKGADNLENCTIDE